ncbi:hypothetical protein SeMB42_g03971 [Synchytrium endobioticum]|nr:hypothetical protein SeMB42_g03971 [Synchytrium endobioticum]
MHNPSPPPSNSKNMDHPHHSSCWKLTANVNAMAPAPQPPDITKDCAGAPIDLLSAVAFQGPATPKPSKPSFDIAHSPFEVQHAVMEELAARVAEIKTDPVKKGKLLDRSLSLNQPVLKFGSRKSDLFDNIHSRQFEKMDGIDSHYAARNLCRRSTVTGTTRPITSSTVEPTPKKPSSATPTPTPTPTAATIAELKRKTLHDPSTSQAAKRVKLDESAAAVDKPPLARKRLTKAPSSVKNAFRSSVGLNTSKPRTNNAAARTAAGPAPASALANNKKHFDLKESLARPLTWKMKTGVYKNPTV